MKLIDRQKIKQFLLSGNFLTTENYLKKMGIHAEIYKPFKKYKAVFFTKTRNDSAVRTAKKLRRNGTKIYFESYCEYLDDDSIMNQEKKNILELLSLSDIAGTSSWIQQETFSKFHPHVMMIPESVHENFFKQTKIHSNDKKLKLIYCGYSNKAKDTLCIADVIKRLQKERNIEMIYLCEKDPQIAELEYQYIPYSQKNITQLFMQGDIMVAPRPMEGIEKRAHSFTKASYPLAVGLPTVASPMPSYLNTPVILCNTQEEWYSTLCTLLDNSDKRNELAVEGRNYVYENYSLDVVGKQYLDILSQFGIERK